ncbi:MAG: cyclic nucleotide-binding domain-containing protein [Planctomycetales bacterium]|nr:cyclic nucleotide-binding domain-containing protein [Planctomycetales bacterium]
MVDVLFHAGNVMYVLAFLVRDMLWLRVLIVVAQSLLMPFYFCAESGEPCWPPLAWGSLTIGINLVQIAILLLQRNPVFLGEAELKLYRSKFRTLRVRDFMKLMAIAKWHREPESTAILRQGDIVHGLWLLTEGAAVVEVDGRRVTEIGAGEFVGEMALLTGEPASATVLARPGVEYVAWEAKDLRGLFASRPEVEGKFRAVLGADLVQKLRRVSEAAAHPSRMMDARQPRE